MGLRFCSLASGSSGNCQFIASEEARILLDVGLAGKRIVESMESIGEQAEKILGILVSHEHSDHIRGIGILSRRFNLPIYANNNTWEEMSGKIGPIKEENKKTFTTGETFAIGDITIKSYPIAHDASEPVAFSFHHGGAKVSIATDLGHVDGRIMEELMDADLLMLESNHDINMLKMGKYPWFLKQRILGDYGHLSNETAGHVIADLLERKGRITNVLLGHLSKENNFPELAFETVKTILEARKIKIGLDINIDLTYRDRVSRVYSIYK
ncbi:Phosphoribosyl 1,2-cyclic phosphodiesterase [Geosporobacter subterraneus DSM 17957]|uniref:Phosphoribosyl 1,2-cyclic phosphodiesterase n=1 Tax=Geosporobacter subterraneus DSM 17957 TaxID=1121919 RepID=A0A1M6KGC0_9FIRM|nr:MBL fold metallo-hydrolase [Geosporobacter subterraneus]SHJ57983.1 Phosphoribosyl 1,2-cyclic phosphodiesterase [Geosporobacter subterraneus DSM 17957]